MIKKMNILNFGIIAFFIALMFVGMPVEANEDNGVLIPFNDGTGGGIWVSEEELGPQPEQLTLSVEVDKDYYVPRDTVIVSGQLWGEEGGKEGMTVHVAIHTETFQTTTIAGAYEVKFPLPLDFPIGGVGITALVNQDYKAYKCDMKHAHLEVFETSFQATDCYLTGEPYTGIVGAGGNWLTFDVFLPKCSNVKVCNVGDGQVKDDVGNFITNLNLDSKGKAQFRYYPPEYPTPYSLSHQLDVHSSGPPVYAMEVPIVLTYSDGNGDDKTIETKIHVCRPPVMLVHGFLGASGTWAEMSAWLRGLNLIPSRVIT